MTGDPGKAPLTLPEEYVAYQVGLSAYTASLAVLLNAKPDPEGKAPVTVDVARWRYWRHSTNTQL